MARKAKPLADRPDPGKVLSNVQAPPADSVNATVETSHRSEPDHAAYAAKSDEDVWARRDKIARTFATIIGLISAILGGGWAIFTYVGQLEAKRAEQTIEYIARWEQSGPQESYRYLERRWAEFLAAVPEDQRDIASQDDFAKNQLLDRFYAHSDQDEQWQTAVGSTYYYFNRLGLCVESDLCSGKVARIFFAEIVTPYLDVFGPFIERKYNSMPGSLDVVRGLVE